MLFRDRMALGVSPLFIRVALAATFLWAGAGKLFFKDMEVQGEQAAILANMGVSITPTGAPAEPPVELPPTDESAAPPAAEQPTDPPTAGPTIAPGTRA